MKTWGDFVYDETSPSCLKWRVGRRSGVNGATIKKPAGSDAGTLTNKGYWVVPSNNTILGKGRVLAHVLIWKMHNGPVPDGFIIDHEDGDSTNNRIANLRLVTSAGNSRNKKMPVTNSSGTCGVGLQMGGTRKESWVAQWKDLDGKKRCKWFSVSKYGNEAAFAMAVKTREQAIEQLNQRGAGYTDRHGKGEYH